MASDAKRGKTYTKFARLIEIAAREGGGDPATNVRLRSLIESAKAESVPNANIERAIKKGTGALSGDQMQEILYEAYGPAGSAFIIECLTDNKNRTLGNVKTILSKNGGRFAESGSVQWMFERRGVVATQPPSLEHAPKRGAGGVSPLPAPLMTIELALIDCGAEDISEADGALTVVTSMNDWPRVRDFLREQHYEIAEAGLHFIAKQHVPVSDAVMRDIQALIDALNEDDDVSEVYVNAVLDS